MLFSSLAPVVAQALPPVEQDYLFQARQMQALSFAVHIPLVCFGIAFPVMVLLMEWWGQRTGDPLCRTIARRWSRVMSAGVHRGDIRCIKHRCSHPRRLPSGGSVWRSGHCANGPSRSGQSSD